MIPSVWNGFISSVITGVVAGVVAPFIIYLGIAITQDAWVTVSDQYSNRKNRTSLLGNQVTVKVVQDPEKAFTKTSLHVEINGEPVTLAVGRCIGLPLGNPTFKVSLSEIFVSESGTKLARFRITRPVFGSAAKCNIKP